MAKSPDAFRTISEVSDWLDTKPHVLRFWESKFKDISPVKRAGGRRYYRPEDMLLIGGIKKLLHDDGMTIKGVQKLLATQGVDHVRAMSQPMGAGSQDNVVAVISDDATAAPRPSKAAKPTPVDTPSPDMVEDVPEIQDAPPPTEQIDAPPRNVVTLENTTSGDVDSTEPLLFPEIAEEEFWEDALSADDVSKVIPLTPRVSKIETPKPAPVFEPIPVQRPRNPISRLYSHAPAQRASEAKSKRTAIIDLIQWAEKRVAG